MSPVLSKTLIAFPRVSVQTAQFLMIFPGLFILIASLLSASLTRFLSHKRLTDTGLALNTITAVGGLPFHKNIVLLFFWALTLGLGLSLWMPMVNARVSSHFAGNERASLMEDVSSGQDISAIFMAGVGGILAVYAWHHDHLVYFIAVPALLSALVFLPDERPERNSPSLPDTPKRKLSLIERRKWELRFLPLDVRLGGARRSERPLRRQSRDRFSRGRRIKPHIPYEEGSENATHN